MSTPDPVAVRLARGPLHLAFPVTEARLQSVCGARFGVASVVPAARWQARRARRCQECEGAARAARSTRILCKIAGLL